MLFGREEELGLLEDLLDAARAGRSGVLVLVGETGVGKSALLAEVERRAAGMRVLRARGVQSEARVPFAGLFELLRPVLDRLDRVAGPQREALEGALALRPALAQDRFAIGAATLSLLAAGSDDDPLLVLVDDAHWLDGSSADALLFAFRRLFEDAVAVVLAVREGEPSLLDGTDLPSRRLRGLDRDATAQLVAQHSAADRAPADDEIARLHTGTGGNPLALVELAGERELWSSSSPLDAPLPVVTSLGRVYLERSAALSEGARDLLLLAAVSDARELATLTRAARHVGLGDDDVAAAEASGLVSVVADRVEFRHPLARSAIYAGAPPERRRAMHAALAAVLPDADADRRAWHLGLATLGPDSAASSALEQAAQRARERSAYDTASHAFEHAGALATDDARRCALLQDAAESAWLGGLPPRALALLDHARECAPAPVDTIRGEQLRGHIATRLGPAGEGHRILLAGAALAEGADPERAIVMLAEAVNSAFYAADAAAMNEAAARIASLAPGHSPRAAFFAAIAQGMALVFGAGSHERGVALVREAVAIVERSDELADDPRLLAWAAMGPLWLRESGVGSALVERAVEVAHARSAVGVLPFLLSHVATANAGADRWADAEAGFHEAVDLASETGQRTDMGFALARLAWLEARQGRETECRAHATQARALAEELGLGLTEIWSHAALGDLELGLGRHEEARRHYDGQLASRCRLGVGDVDLSPEPELIELALRLGRLTDAADHLASFEAAAVAKGQPWSLARAARSRALLAPDDQIDGYFSDALAHHDQTPDAFEKARTRVAYGQRLRRARRRVDARTELRAAFEVFERLGATPWAETARVELAATGETARRRDASTRDQLTPQELQIALLLGGGRTTREAAASLFLSPKTVEYHLRSVYRKLQINSRDELRQKLADAQDGP